MSASSVASLATALLALVVSAVTARRQNQLGRSGSVVLGPFKESRSPQWFEAQEYVLNKLAVEHAPECGWRDLPEQARNHVTTIGLFYDDLAKQVAFDMIDEDLVIGSYGTMITRIWDILAPYVYVERRTPASHFWIFFEDLAARAAAKHPEVVYRKLGLRSRPPRHTPDGLGIPTGGNAS